MNFRQMERYYMLVDVIRQYEIILRQIESGLSAVRFDEVRGGTFSDPHRIEAQIQHKDEHAHKLAELKILAEAQRPEVEETIQAAAKNNKKRIKIGLIIRLRYLGAHSWSEIAAITGLKEKEAKRLVMRSLEG